MNFSVNIKKTNFTSIQLELLNPGFMRCLKPDLLCLICFEVFGYLEFYDEGKSDD